VSKVPEIFLQPGSIPSRRGVCAEKVFPHVIVDANNLHPLGVKKTHGFAAD
jgi:hypothetical protein